MEISEARVQVAEVIGLAGLKEESADLLASGVALARQTLGPRHPVVAFDEIKLGFALLDRHRYDEAERALRDAISILAPLGHYEVGSALRYLGLAAMERKRYAEAERHFAEAEEVFRARLGPEHVYRLTASLSRSEALLHLGRPVEAEELLRGLAGPVERSKERGRDCSATSSASSAKPAALRGRIAAEALTFHRRARAITLALFGTAEHPAMVSIDLQIALDHLARPTPEGPRRGPRLRRRRDRHPAQARSGEPADGGSAGGEGALVELSGPS